MKFVEPVLFAAVFALSQISATFAEPAPVVNDLLQLLGLSESSGGLLDVLLGSESTGGLEIQDVIALQALSGGLPLGFFGTGGLPFGSFGIQPYGGGPYGGGPYGVAYGAAPYLGGAYGSGFPNAQNTASDIHFSLK